MDFNRGGLTIYLKMLGGKLGEILFQVGLLRNRFPILMFHRVGRERQGIDSNQFICEKEFEKIVIGIKSIFEIVGLLDLLRFNRAIKERICSITLDDGWIDNYETAFPILKRHGVPATIFICGENIGTTRKYWFERTERIIEEIFRQNDPEGRGNDILRQVLREGFGGGESKEEVLWKLNNSMKERKPSEILNWLEDCERKLKIRADGRRSVLNWDEVWEMGKTNISFGSHGMSHWILPNLSRSEKEYEIAESKNTLEKRGVNFIPVFSFPDGQFDAACIEIGEKAGYEFFLTANMKRRRCDLGEKIWNRINVRDGEVCWIMYAILKGVLQGRI